MQLKITLMTHGSTAALHALRKIFAELKNKEFGGAFYRPVLKNAALSAR